jgi:hypothetical protein
VGCLGQGIIPMFRTAFAGAFVGTAALAMAFTTPADAQRDRVPVGTLECSLSSLSAGLIVGIACNFKPKGEALEAYVGTITRAGPHVSVAGGAIIWGVFAATNRHAGMLAGTYDGATPEESVAADLGANVLVGGSNRLVALQPVSVQGQNGLDIAAGIQSLELQLAQ